MGAPVAVALIGSAMSSRHHTAGNASFDDNKPKQRNHTKVASWSSAASTRLAYERAISASRFSASKRSKACMHVCEVKE